MPLPRPGDSSKGRDRQRMSPVGLELGPVPAEAPLAPPSRPRVGFSRSSPRVDRRTFGAGRTAGAHPGATLPTASEEPAGRRPQCRPMGRPMRRIRRDVLSTKSPCYEVFGGWCGPVSKTGSITPSVCRRPTHRRMLLAARCHSVRLSSPTRERVPSLKRRTGPRGPGGSDRSPAGSPSWSPKPWRGGAFWKEYVEYEELEAEIEETLFQTTYHSYFAPDRPRAARALEGRVMEAPACLGDRRGGRVTP